MDFHPSSTTKTVSLNLYFSLPESLSIPPQTSIKSTILHDKLELGLRDIKEVLLNNNFDIKFITCYCIFSDNNWLILTEEYRIPIEAQATNLKLYLIENSSSQIKELQDRIAYLESSIHDLECRNVDKVQQIQVAKKEESKLYFGYLYSYPLVEINNNKTSKAHSFLDFQNEITMFYELFTTHSCFSTFEVATKENFIKILSRRPRLLHITCHGIPGNENLPDRDNQFYLYFEKENKVLDKFYFSEIEAILNENKENLTETMVFISVHTKNQKAVSFPQRHKIINFIIIK